MSLHLHHKLDLHPWGLQWLQKSVALRDECGRPLTDHELRQSLFSFIKEETGYGTSMNSWH